MASRRITAIISSVLAAMIFLFAGNRTWAATGNDQNKNNDLSSQLVSNISSYILDDMPLSQYPQGIVESIPFVDSARACILDESGNMLLGKNAHEKYKIASITKVMAALVVADYPMNMRISVSANAASIPGSFLASWKETNVISMR